MANVYIEARPKGAQEGTRIDDYVIEDHADSVLATTRTQREAIDWAKARGHKPLVARVRHLNDKKKPDHCRHAEYEASPSITHWMRDVAISTPARTPSPSGCVIRPSTKRSRETSPASSFMVDASTSISTG